MTKKEKSLEKAMFLFNKEKHPRIYKKWMEDEQKAKEGKLLRYNHDGTINTTYFDENLNPQKIDIKELKKHFRWNDLVRNLED